MKIAVEGCMHGELNKMYETITEIENREGYKIDLVRILDIYKLI
jgi:lariat debranching enzyme